MACGVGCYAPIDFPHEDLHDEDTIVDNKQNDDSRSTLHASYDNGNKGTDLYRMIEDKEWVKVYEFLVSDQRNPTSLTVCGAVACSSDTDPALIRQGLIIKKQARTWVVKFDDRTSDLIWARLPIQAAIMHNAPYKIVHKLIKLYPKAIEFKDEHKYLPLHQAFIQNSDENVISLLLNMYPEAVYVKGGPHERLPHECARHGSKNPLFTILDVYVNQGETQFKDKKKIRSKKTNKTNDIVINDDAVTEKRAAIMNNASAELSVEKTEIETELVKSPRSRAKENMKSFFGVKKSRSVDDEDMIFQSPAVETKDDNATEVRSDPANDEREDAGAAQEEQHDEEKLDETNEAESVISISSIRQQASHSSSQSKTDEVKMEETPSIESRATSPIEQEKEDSSTNSDLKDLALVAAVTSSPWALPAEESSKETALVVASQDSASQSAEEVSEETALVVATQESVSSQSPKEASQEEEEQQEPPKQPPKKRLSVSFADMTIIGDEEREMKNSTVVDAKDGAIPANAETDDKSVASGGSRSTRSDKKKSSSLRKLLKGAKKRSSKVLGISSKREKSAAQTIADDATDTIGQKEEEGGADASATKAIDEESNNAKDDSIPTTEGKEATTAIIKKEAIDLPNEADVHEEATATDGKIDEEFSTLHEKYNNGNNGTDLYRMIENKEWVEVYEFLNSDQRDPSSLTSIFASDDDDALKKQGETIKEQVRTWVVKFDDETSDLLWARLPIHAAVIYNAPYKVVHALIKSYPKSLQCKDEKKYLPLHQAYIQKSDENIISLLTESYPHAVSIKGGANDKLPDECADEGETYLLEQSFNKDIGPAEFLEFAVNFLLPETENGGILKSSSETAETSSIGKESNSIGNKEESEPAVSPESKSAAPGAQSFDDFCCGLQSLFVTKAKNSEAAPTATDSTETAEKEADEAPKTDVETIESSNSTTKGLEGVKGDSDTVSDGGKTKSKEQLAGGYYMGMLPFFGTTTKNTGAENAKESPETAVTSTVADSAQTSVKENEDSQELEGETAESSVASPIVNADEETEEDLPSDTPLVQSNSTAADSTETAEKEADEAPRPEVETTESSNATMKVAGGDSDAVSEADSKKSKEQPAGGFYMGILPFFGTTTKNAGASSTDTTAEDPNEAPKTESDAPSAVTDSTETTAEEVDEVGQTNDKVEKDGVAESQKTATGVQPSDDYCCGLQSYFVTKEKNSGVPSPATESTETAEKEGDEIPNPEGTTEEVSGAGTGEKEPTSDKGSKTNNSDTYSQQDSASTTSSKKKKRGLNKLLKGAKKQSTKILGISSGKKTESERSMPTATLNTVETAQKSTEELADSESSTVDSNAEKEEQTKENTNNENAQESSEQPTDDSITAAGDKAKKEEQKSTSTGWFSSLMFGSSCHSEKEEIVVSEEEPQKSASEEPTDDDMSAVDENAEKEEQTNTDTEETINDEQVEKTSSKETPTASPVTSEEKSLTSSAEKTESISEVVDAGAIGLTSNVVITHPRHAISDWVGRLIFDAKNRLDRGAVMFEVKEAPSEYSNLVGTTVPLNYRITSTDCRRIVKESTRDVRFTKEATKSKKKHNNILPDRLNDLKHVCPLESLAGSRPTNDVYVSLSGAVRVNNGRIEIDETPVQVSGTKYCLVTILRCIKDEVYEVQHYSKDTKSFSGDTESIRIGKTEKFDPKGIETSSANADGWYFYGDDAPDESESFVVKAIEPRSAIRVKPDRIVTGKAKGTEYLYNENWKDTKKQKGSLSTALLVPDTVNEEDAIEQWRENERAIVIHLFGGTQNDKSSASGPVPGHTSYGTATVVRDPLTDELIFDIEYAQLYPHNAGGILSGFSKRSCYNGDLQNGLIHSKPVSDIVVKLNLLTKDYKFGSHVVSPLTQFVQEIDIMMARYRIGDGTGIALTSPSTSCVQDSNQALYTTLQKVRDEVNDSDQIKEWLSKNRDSEEAINYMELRALRKDIEDDLVPQGFVRSDWKLKSKSMVGTTKEKKNPLKLCTPNKVASRKNSKVVLPRRSHDEMAKTFISHGGSLYFIRTNIIGGDNNNLVPLEPTSFAGPVVDDCCGQA